MTESTKSVAVISYPFKVGGQIKDRRCWMAEVDGELYDYDSKPALKRKLENDGYRWIVVRKHKNGTDSVIERRHEAQND